MAHYETHSTAPLRKVKRIQFGVLDPDFIVRRGGWDGGSLRGLGGVWRRVERTALH